MAEKKAGLKPFTKGLLIYIAVFIVISAAALGILYGFLSAYEASRPNSCIEKYISGVTEDSLPAECRDIVSSLGGVKSEEENGRYLAELLSSSTWKKDVKNSSDTELLYLLTHEKGPLGILHLTQTGKSSFGFTCWEVAQAEYNLNAHIKSDTLNVPADYSVSFDGRTLDSSYITDGRAEYETLQLFYEYDDYYSEGQLPRLTRYETGTYLGESSILIKDPEGREFTPDELSEEYLLNNCSEDQKERVRDFLLEFFDRYVYFGGNVNGAYVSSRWKVLELVQKDSPLYTRLRGPLTFYGFSYSKSCTILSLDINMLSDIGGRYLADITYVTEIVGLYDPIEVTSNVKLVIADTEEKGLLVEVMHNS